MKPSLTKQAENTTTEISKLLKLTKDASSKCFLVEPNGKPCKDAVEKYEEQLSHIEQKQKQGSVIGFESFSNEEKKSFDDLMEGANARGVCRAFYNFYKHSGLVSQHTLMKNVEYCNNVDEQVEEMEKDFTQRFINNRK